MLQLFDSNLKDNKTLEESLDSNNLQSFNEILEDYKHEEIKSKA